MPLEIRVPMMGESVVEATVGRWLKQVGEPVAAGEPLVELETDKVNLEVGAEQAGVLERIERATGDTVKIGEVLGVIGTAEGARPAEPARQAGEGGDGRPRPALAVTPAPARPGEITPVARRIAEERGIDLAQVPGTGPGGRTTKEDVLRYAEEQSGVRSPESEVRSPESEVRSPKSEVAAAPQVPVPAEGAPAPRPPLPAAPRSPLPAPGRSEERARMTRRRQTIAQRLIEAQQTAAMLTTFNEIDMSAVMDVRKRRKDAFKERYGVSLGFMSFFTKAVIGALKDFPLLNAEIQGDPLAGTAEILIKHYYDIGVAVSTPGGLVVPVLRDADRLSFAEIERGIADLAERARGGTLTLDELRGGTFSITNGGIFGSLLSTPILNPPQTGILGMHKIQDRPVALGGEVVIRPMMYVALTYDHRLVDGQEAVRFLVRVKELVEEPQRLLLEG